MSLGIAIGLVAIGLVVLAIEIRRRRAYDAFLNRRRDRAAQSRAQGPGSRPRRGAA